MGYNGQAVRLGEPMLVVMIALVWTKGTIGRIMALIMYNQNVFF